MFKENDRVVVELSGAEGEYFGYECFGTVRRVLTDGRLKVELDDTASQDSEGYNAIVKVTADCCTHLDETEYNPKQSLPPIKKNTPRFSNRGPAILVSLIIGMMGLLHLFATLSIQPEEPVKKVEVAPLFEVGDCIRLIKEKVHPLSNLSIYRVMAIETGNAYRACQLGDHCTAILNGQMEPVFILFFGQEFYEKTSCGGK